MIHDSKIHVSGFVIDASRKRVNRYIIFREYIQYTWFSINELTQMYINAGLYFPTTKIINAYNWSNSILFLIVTKNNMK